ncbi:MAG: acetyl-CoA carboxylase [Actinobacteria bacterium]|nr:acetyl-CoA carboxylase [Actinomycetota bacterium]
MSGDPSMPGWLDEVRPVAGLPGAEDPLGFPGYRDQLRRARQRTGAEESVAVADAAVDGHAVVVAVFDFDFMGGSMSRAAGGRLVAAAERARSRRVPLLTVTASGGARVQESMCSLVQMQAAAAALTRLRGAGLPHLNVACHPTTGGVWASTASVADVILAVADATVAFAGARVRGDEGDAFAFTAAGKLESGAVDAVVRHEGLGEAVGRYLEVLTAAIDTEPRPCEAPGALPGATGSAGGWEAVELARAPERPRADAYLREYFDRLVEISGDRCGGHDLEMRCGIGLRGGEAVAFVAQTGGPNSPAGFRTAIRTLDLADRLQIPVLTLIDTPGAHNDAAAERAGLGTAIAQTFAAVAASRVPITSLLIGEGGSGGALAISSPDNLWAVPSSYFSVISPEGAAAILHRDPTRAPELAELLRLAPHDLADLGIVRGIVAAATPHAAASR